MDIKIAELFKESRQNSKIRDAQLAMQNSKIPDLDWKFDEDIQLIKPVQEQVYPLEQTQEKEQPITPPPNSSTHGERTTSTTSRRSNHRSNSSKSSTYTKN